MVRLPLYLKISQILLGLVAFFSVLYLGRDIIVPLIFALLIAILLNPVVNFFMRKGINKVVSIALAIILMMALLFGIFYFIGTQVAMFREALPELKEKVEKLYEQASGWASDKLNIPQKKIESVLETKRSEGMNQAGSMVGNTLLTISSMLILVLLIPVYIFLFLFYKPLLLDFIARLFPHKHGTVGEVLFTAKGLIQNYLLGLMIEMVIVATLNSTALLIIGVDYAIVFGVIGAILNLIPYIGGIVAISLPMIMAFATGTPTQALFVFLAYLVVQLIDNNFLVPVIVASKVKVNALVSIVVVLTGGAIWGVAGMFLSIPLIAIVKVICDHIDPLKPLGFLIGDNMPSVARDIFKFGNMARVEESEKKKAKTITKKK